MIPANTLSPKIYGKTWWNWGPVCNYTTVTLTCVDVSVTVQWMVMKWDFFYIVRKIAISWTNVWISLELMFGSEVWYLNQNAVILNVN